MRAMQFILGYLVLLFPTFLTQDPGCDYEQYTQDGKIYYVYSPNFPNSYSLGSSCRWSAIAPANSKIQAICDLGIPVGSDGYCSYGRLRISVLGTPSVNEARDNCGYVQLRETSVANKMTIGLFVSRNPHQGRFNCTLWSYDATQPQECQCGWSGVSQSTKIVGGTIAAVHEFPSTVAVFFKNNPICGATIISNSYLLTAAHCIYRRLSQDVTVVAGIHNVERWESTAVQRSIARMIMHPLYNPETFANDLAVLQTSSPIPFSQFIGPACLPFKYATQDFTGSTVIATGWGLLEFLGEKSSVLRKVGLRVISTRDCVTANSGVTTGQFCTYAEGKDACQFDSGGPLIWVNRNNGRQYLYGVISYGTSCASTKPAVQTRVTAYLDWIVQQSKGATFCQL